MMLFTYVVDVGRWSFSELNSGVGGQDRVREYPKQPGSIPKVLSVDVFE